MPNWEAQLQRAAQLFQNFDTQIETEDGIEEAIEAVENINFALSRTTH